MTWRDKIKIHPAAELFPMMPESEIEALAKDIEANGLLGPIVLWSPDPHHYELQRKKRKRFEWHLLDGRNRLAAIERLGLLKFDADNWPLIDILTATYASPITILGPEIEPFDYAISANIHRRHLTAEDKRRLIAEILKAKPEQSNRQIAETVKADHKTVGTVRTEMEGRGEIPHVSTRADTKGRQQPAAKPPRRSVLADKEFTGQPAELVRDRGEPASEPSRVEYITARWKRDASGLEVAKIVRAHLRFDMPAADVEGLRLVIEQFIGDGQ